MEWSHLLAFPQLGLHDLGVVRHHSGGWLSHDKQQLDGGVHSPYPGWSLPGDEVGGSLLYGDLQGKELFMFASL